jgi:putative transposase
MKASKFSEAQIAFVLKQAEDGTPIGVFRRGILTPLAG